MSQLQKLKFSKATFLVNKDLGYFPYFQFILRSRLKKKKAVNVVVTGEAGEGKSYEAWTLCILLDPKFTVDQIVYFYSSYMKLVRHLGMYRPIMFDEPSYAMGKRDWFKQVNKVLVQTIESQRFKIHPIFIPIINKSLLDKTIREHLIQFQVIVRDRGIADVYRIQASQFEEKIYHHPICRLHYPLIGECPTEYFEGKNRDSCLGCEKLKICPIFRAQYERKKASIQDKRYEQAEAEAEYLETKVLTDDQIENFLYSIRTKFTNDNGKIDVDLLRIVAREDFGVHLGHNRAYRIKKAIEYHHQNEFV